MKRRSWCLALGQSWRVMDLGGDERILRSDGGDIDTRIEAARNAFQELGYDGGDVLLALPSEMCLVGRIPAALIPPRCDDQTRLFLLEETLPVAAEEVTADFVEGEGQTLGIATLTSPLANVLERLEALGLSIQAIVPWSLLAAQTWRGEHPSADVFVGLTESGYEMTEFTGGQLSGWSVVGTEPDVAQRLQFLAAERAQSLRVVCDDAFLSTTDASIVWTSANTSWDQAAHAAAQRTLSGLTSPLIDLRRDGLAGTSVPRALRGHIRALQFTTAVLLLTLLGGVLWQGFRYRRAADDLLSQQEALFRQILPDQPIPAGLRSRLHSELSRLQKQQNEAAQVPGRDSGLTTLVRFLQGVPVTLRLKINGLSITGHQVNVRSEVRTAGDGSAFVQALRDAGFRARVPRSLRSGEAYSVDFEASLEPASLTARETP